LAVEFGSRSAYSPSFTVKRWAGRSGLAGAIDDGIATANVVQTFATFKANGFVPAADSPYFCTLTNVDADPMGLTGNVGQNS